MKSFGRGILTIAISALLAAELILRLGFGFCDAPLYQSSDRYEYILQPSQDRWRLGAHVVTNSYCMRSEEPDSTRKRILGLGDSVLFGCTWMDHDSLATTLFSNETDMQMLNIACGSWGPSNCYAYLMENGTFGAEEMVMVVSSHDAFDEMSFYPVVGRFPNYPSRQHLSAIHELWCRYAWPWIKMHTRNAPKKYTDEVDPDKRVVLEAQFNESVHQKAELFTKGFDNLLLLSKEKDIPLTVYLHAEQYELRAGHYNAMGQMIVDWADRNGVRLILGMEAGERPWMYHDNIHLNEKGQRFLADVLKQTLCE